MLHWIRMMRVINLVCFWILEATLSDFPMHSDFSCWFVICSLHCIMLWLFSTLLCSDYAYMSVEFYWVFFLHYCINNVISILHSIDSTDYICWFANVEQFLDQDAMFFTYFASILLSFSIRIFVRYIAL